MFAAPLRLRSRDADDAARKVTWLELFFDLVFVAAVSQVGAPLAVQFDVPGLGRFALLFVLIWWAWHGHTSYATRFDTDDGLHRALTFLQLFVAAVMAVNAKGALDSVDSAGFAAAYAVMRLLLVAQYVRARRVPESRQLTTAYIKGFGLAALLWLASAVVPAPARFWLWGVALVIDVATPLVTSRHLVAAPPHAAHLPERFGLFTIILIGDAMVGVMRGMEEQATWSVDAALSAVMSMGVVYAIWWWYFDAARAAEERVIRSTRETRRFHLWTYAHLPLYTGILVTGVGAHHVISGAAGAGHLHADASWILCGAAALVMASMTLVTDAGAHVEERRTLPSLAAHYTFAAAALALGAVGPTVPPSVLMSALAGLFALQVAWSIRAHPTVET